MSKITIRDVAKKCNVSVSTVSRAINNQDDINPETKNKILSAIDELGYIPNSNARSLKITESNVIAVLIKGLSNPFYLPMFSIIESKINSNGYTFSFYKIEENEDEISVALKLINEEKLKGIIFLGGFFVQNEEKLKKIKVPFVISTILNKDIIMPNCAFIGVDDFEESKKIVNYLISLGHKKIAFVGSRKDDKSIGMLRKNGYIAALKDNKLPVVDNLIFFADKNVNPYNFEYGYDIIENILKINKDFTAIYAISDSIAIGITKKLLEIGYKIPDNFSIVGFDGLRINRFITPSITTIKQPIEEIASSACDVLFDMIQNGNNKQKIIKFDGELWVGQTTRKID
ncbi:LacI family transcriptional regulator [Criibacterium bergeronii]|uniref:LacI family transcriptional regulator n=1 Tax=Criibacterium bergeronii TaxID=1871336 RepID=A0A552VDM9_9FIRM|nr:LacI family DNA-binding transcriptional regulator [Criibacterium bergeronii]TRW28581.1 LacI family transcriptional regulator [Criibacterium bergeronii]